MMVVYESQLLDMVDEAMKKHISRDPTVHAEDIAWENKNFSRTLFKRMRELGLPFIPVIT